MAWTLGQINPFRYRSYYYDVETGLFYVGARYYDPVIGRWISPEPNVDYGMFDGGAGLLAYNVYAYCANDPVNYCDPSGCVIELSSTATEAERAQYDRAIAYLQTSKTAKALIAKLQNSKTVFKIMFVYDDNDYYDPSTNRIYWDIYSGLVMSDGTSVQSAALGLAHEMGHGAQHLDGYFKGKKVAQIEANCLSKYETPIAKQLREPTRKSYTSFSGVQRMNNSTHFVTTAKKWNPGGWPWQWFRCKTVITQHNS